MRAGKREAWLLLFALRGAGGLRSLGLGHPLLELIHTAGCIYELLLAGVERMAGIADTNNNNRLGGTGFDHVAARATDFRFHILRMNIFHKRPKNLTRSGPMTSLIF